MISKAGTGSLWLLPAQDTGERLANIFWMSSTEGVLCKSLRIDLRGREIKPLEQSVTHTNTQQPALISRHVF